MECILLTIVVFVHWPWRLSMRASSFRWLAVPNQQSCGHNSGQLKLHNFESYMFEGYRWAVFDYSTLFMIESYLSNNQNRIVTPADLFILNRWYWTHRLPRKKVFQWNHLKETKIHSIKTANLTQDPPQYWFRILSSSILGSPLLSSTERTNQRLWMVWQRGVRRPHCCLELCTPFQ